MRFEVKRDVADIGIRIGIAVVVLLISLIGGRVVKAFTRNWLVKVWWCYVLYWLISYCCKT